MTIGAANKDIKSKTIKTQKAKQNFAENHGHNILRILVNLPSFLFTTSETKRDY